MPLGESGVYTVSEVCRILQPSMTSRKVHYWINTGLLSRPLVHHRGSGVPTLLTFRQLLEIRTVQRIRDELRFSLRAVRQAFSYVLETLFAAKVSDVRFERGPDGTLLARAAGGQIVVPGGQFVLPITVEALNLELAEVQTAFRAGRFSVPTHAHIACDVKIMAGTACVIGTRVDTAVIGAFLADGGFDDSTVASIREVYPRLSAPEVEDALLFEGANRLQSA